MINLLQWFLPPVLRLERLALSVKDKVVLSLFSKEQRLALYHLLTVAIYVARNEQEKKIILGVRTRIMKETLSKTNNLDVDRVVNRSPSDYLPDFYNEPKNT